MNRYRCLAVLLLTISAVLSAVTAHALINPIFTPIHLVKQAGLILSVELKQGESKDQYSAAVREVLKGKTDTKALRLDLSKAINTQNADALRDLAAAGRLALFFVGEFGDDKGDSSAGPAKTRAFLHLGGQWAEFDGGQGEAWTFRQIDSKSQGVWAGGTDMLRRAVDYILQDDDPEVPVADGAAWSADHKKIASVRGRLKAVRPVDLAGDGKLALFVACDQGDRVLACDRKTRAFTDLTVARGLQSKSLAFAWGDFAGKGKLDLISFDGKALSLHGQQADGTFQARVLEIAGAVENDCVSLAAVDCGSRVTGLLVSGDLSPVLVVFDDSGKGSARALTARGADWKKLGKAAPCLVADFDGDGLPDVLQPCSAASVLYRGTARGKFAPGEACPVKLGTGPSAACVADFDADGRLDVFTVSADAVRIWQNEGEGKFAEALHLSGEIAYISKPGGIDCMVGDVNNDGRQDALIAYGAMSPQLFFNRGFRSFGHAHTLDLGERQLLPAAEQGQQSACLGDFDGDGAQDMVLALTSGEIWAFFRENDDGEARSAVAAVPGGGDYQGPITATGWIGKRCLGAWNVVPGVSHGFFGRRDAGPVTVQWRLPGSNPQTKEVVLEKQTVRVEIK